MASRDFAVNVLSYLSLFSNSCRSHAKRIRESSSSFSRLACLSSRVDFDNRFSKSSCVLAACRSILLATLSAVSLVRPNSFSRLISFSTASAFLFLEIISSSVVAMILFISASSFSFRLIKSSIAFPSSFVPILMHKRLHRYFICGKGFVIPIHCASHFLQRIFQFIVRGGTYFLPREYFSPRINNIHSIRGTLK